MKGIEMNLVMKRSIKGLVVVLFVLNLLGLIILPLEALAQTAPPAADQGGSKRYEPGDYSDPLLKPEGQAAAPAATSGTRAIAIALVVGLSCIGAGWAVGHVGSAAVGAVSEKPEIFGRSLVFVGLAEGIAIYGLIIGILLLFRG